MYFYMVPLIPGIVLAQSRGAWLALGIGVLALYFRRTWLLTIVAVAGIAFWLVASPSDAERLWFWTAAYNELSLLGRGAGSFASQLYFNGATPVYPEYVHNDALQLVYEYGIAAAVPIVIFAFVLLRTKEREWPVVLVFATMGLYSFPLFMAITSFVGLLATGRIVRSWAMDGIFRTYCGYAVLSRGTAGRQDHDAIGGETVSVVG
jgi:hypothetical protein